MENVFISDLHCAYLSDESTAVISDLHLGFEEEMNLHGLFLPKLQLSHVEKMDNFSRKILEMETEDFISDIFLFSKLIAFLNTIESRVMIVGTGSPPSRCWIHH